MKRKKSKKTTNKFDSYDYMRSLFVPEVTFQTLFCDDNKLEIVYSMYHNGKYHGEMPATFTSQEAYEDAKHKSKNSSDVISFFTPQTDGTEKVIN